MINLQDRRRVHDKCDCFLDTDRWRVGSQLTLWTMHCAVLIDNAAVAAVLSVHVGEVRSGRSGRRQRQRLQPKNRFKNTVTVVHASWLAGSLARPRSWSCTRPSAYQLHHVASQRHGRRWGCTQDTMSDRWLYDTCGVCAIKQTASPGRAGCEPLRLQTVNGRIRCTKRGDKKGQNI